MDDWIPMYVVIGLQGIAFLGWNAIAEIRHRRWCARFDAETCEILDAIIARYPVTMTTEAHE